MRNLTQFKNRNYLSRSLSVSFAPMQTNGLECTKILPSFFFSISLYSLFAYIEWNCNWRLSAIQHCVNNIKKRYFVRKKEIITATTGDCVHFCYHVYVMFFFLFRFFVWWKWFESYEEVKMKHMYSRSHYITVYRPRW